MLPHFSLSRAIDWLCTIRNRRETSFALLFTNLIIFFVTKYILTLIESWVTELPFNLARPFGQIFNLIFYFIALKERKTQFSDNFSFQKQLTFWKKKLNSQKHFFTSCKLYETTRETFKIKLKCRVKNLEMCAKKSLCGCEREEKKKSFMYWTSRKAPIN